jgi:hypothetical protein
VNCARVRGSPAAPTPCTHMDRCPAYREVQGPLKCPDWPRRRPGPLNERLSAHRHSSSAAERPSPVDTGLPAPEQLSPSKLPRSCSAQLWTGSRRVRSTDDSPAARRPRSCEARIRIVGGRNDDGRRPYRGPRLDRNVYVLDIAADELTAVGEPGAWCGLRQPAPGSSEPQHRRATPDGWRLPPVLPLK